MIQALLHRIIAKHRSLKISITFRTIHVARQKNEVSKNQLINIRYNEQHSTDVIL